MINVDQYRSMPDQYSVIGPKCGSITINEDQYRSILLNKEQCRSMLDQRMLYNWCQCHKFDPALIGID